MMSAATGLGPPIKRSRRPARYLIRCEAGRWRLYFRALKAGCFPGRHEAVRAAERLAAEAAQLGGQSYLVIESLDQGTEVRRLRRASRDGDHRVLTKVRWLAPGGRATAQP